MGVGLVPAVPQDDHFQQHFLPGRHLDGLIACCCSLHARQCNVQAMVSGAVWYCARRPRRALGTEVGCPRGFHLLEEAVPAVTRACDGAGVALASGLLPLLLLRGVWRRFSTASHRGYAARASCRWARRWVPGRVRGHRPLGGWGHRVDGRLPSRQCNGYE